MTLIDKAEALAAILKTPGRFAGCTEKQVRKMVAEWIDALPARGAGVPADAKDCAAQAREAHLREAAAAVRARYMGDNNREDQEVLRCEAAILALIGGATPMSPSKPIATSTTQNPEDPNA